MSRPVVDPDELADVTRRLAEVYATVKDMRRRLEVVPTPLATLAALRVLDVEETLVDCLEGLAPMVSLVLSVTAENGSVTGD